MELETAGDADVPCIVRLLNRAYRGRDGDAGWNSEAHYMDGERTNDALLRGELLDHPGATLLVWKDDGAVLGCVWLEPETDNSWYLGSLAVDPLLQNRGAGRRLLTAAEEWIVARGGTNIRLRVVNIRETLIAWYERREYCLTGDTEPYPYADGRRGRPRRPDLHFVVLTKRLSS